MITIWLSCSQWRRQRDVWTCVCVYIYISISMSSLVIFYIYPHWLRTSSFIKIQRSRLSRFIVMIEANNILFRFFATRPRAKLKMTKTSACYYTCCASVQQCKMECALLLYTPSRFLGTYPSWSLKRDHHHSLSKSSPFLKTVNSLPSWKLNSSAFCAS